MFSSIFACISKVIASIFLQLRGSYLCTFMLCYKSTNIHLAIGDFDWRYASHTILDYNVRSRLKRLQDKATRGAPVEKYDEFIQHINTTFGDLLDENARFKEVCF